MKSHVFPGHIYRHRVCAYISLLVMSCYLWNCDGGDKGTIAPQLDPGVVNFVLYDANGDPLVAPSIGGVLIEITNACIDAEETAECNKSYSFYDCFKVSDDPEKYRVLIIANETQCYTDTIGSAYINDRSEMDKIAHSIISICSADNCDLAVSQYSLKIVPK